ncbi:MAG TPA: response regulator [Alphaproteobacteria bacterium]|nr:response regulator [Alphaproteobacteria bacterium]
MAWSVLVVDDEPNIVLSLEFLMKRAGLEVRTASDGEGALASVRSDIPDLILLDISMPNGDGFEVCRKIRNNPAWRDVRIIMLTAKGRDSERERGLAAGADDYITKPFSTHDVIDRVQAQIGATEG